jgi:hypothetical protein
MTRKIMHCAIGFLILAVATGIVLPYFLQDRFVGMGITLPTWRGSTSPAAEHQISGDTIMRFLRVLGVCFALAAAFCFVVSRRASRREPLPPRVTHEQ